MTRSKVSKKINKLTNHEKLVNLISIRGDKDVTALLQSIDRIFIECFGVKQSELPWLTTNSDEAWDNFLRKVRVAFLKIYYEFDKKKRIYH